MRNCQYLPQIFPEFGAQKTGRAVLAGPKEWRVRQAVTWTLREMP